MVSRPFLPSDRSIFQLMPTEIGRGIVLCDPHPVGWASFLPIPGFTDVADGEIFVLEKERRKRYGSHLLALIEQHLPTSYQSLSFDFPEKESADILPFLLASGYQFEHIEQTYKLGRAYPSIPQNQAIRYTPPYFQASLFREIYDDGFSPHRWHQPFDDDAEVGDWLAGGEIAIYAPAGIPIGIAGIRRKGNRIEIEPFGIRSAEQGNGHGRKFLTQLLPYVSRIAAEVFITVWEENHGAIHLYESVGFILCKKRFYLLKNRVFPIDRMHR